MRLRQIAAAEFSIRRERYFFPRKFGFENANGRGLPMPSGERITRMNYLHGKTNVALPELARVLGYCPTTCVRWLHQCGYEQAKESPKFNISLTEAGRCFGVSVLYLSLLLAGKDRLIDTRQASKTLGLSKFQILENPVACMIDKPGIRRRYSAAMIEALARNIDAENGQMSGQF